MSEEMINIKSQKQGYKGWWETNKKTVLIIGGLILITGSSYVICKKWDTIRGMFINFEPETAMMSNQKVTIGIRSQNTETLTKIINEGEAFDVIRHIRNLPKGWKASPEKIEEAVNLGINLLENQTIVNPYIKNVA